MVTTFYLNSNIKTLKIVSHDSFRWEKIHFNSINTTISMQCRDFKWKESLIIQVKIDITLVFQQVCNIWNQHCTLFRVQCSPMNLWEKSLTDASHLDSRVGLKQDLQCATHSQSELTTNLCPIFALKALFKPHRKCLQSCRQIGSNLQFNINWIRRL